MAWPKKGTRKLVVDGVSFRWHYAPHCLLCGTDFITVGVESKGYYLYVDPYRWGFEFRPQDVTDAIRWAMSHGWSPSLGPTRTLAWDDRRQQHEWLADGARHGKDAHRQAND